MKFLFNLALVFGVVALSQAMTEDEKKALESQLLSECKNKESATDADVQKMINREHPTTQTGKCLSACVVETIGVLKDNKVSVEGTVKIAKMVHPGNEEAIELAKKIANACESVTDPNRCEMAAKLMLCSEAAAIANGLDPKKML